jgi:hypothetical protein
LKQVNSDASSVKMVTSSVFMAGPAGYQFSTGAGAALAKETEGR